MATRTPSSFSSPIINQSRISRTIGTTLTTLERDSLKRFLSRKKSQGLIDSAELFGKVKVVANIRNSDTCLSTALSPDGKYYAVALANGLVNVYNSRNDNLIYTLNKPKSSSVNSTSTSSTCVRFKPFTNNVPLRLEDTNQNQPDHLPLPRLVPNSTNPLTLLPTHLSRRRSSFRNDSIDILLQEHSSSTKDYLLTGTFADGTVKTFRFLTDECVQAIQEDRETLSMDYDPNGRYFVTSGGDGILHVYDSETGQRVLSYEPPFNENAKFQRIYSITFNPVRETEFLTGGLDGKVRFYDTRLPAPYKKLYGQFITGEGIAFHPSGNEFCTASWQHRNTLQIYDYRSSKTLKTFGNFDESIPNKLPSTMLYSAKYYQNGKYLVLGGAEPASLAVIDRHSGNAVAGIRQLGRSVYCIYVWESNVVMVTGKEVALLDFFV